LKYKNQSLLAMIALTLMLALSGCKGVQLNPTYDRLLRSTSELSKATAARAALPEDQGGLSSAQKSEALEKQSEVWQLFVDGADGKAPQ
jgi:hypothetical protein